MHEFDPPGVGARDLKECLLLQAKHLEEDTHELVKIINDHLKRFGEEKLQRHRKEMEIDLEDVVELCKIIYSMDPKPGRSFMVRTLITSLQMFMSIKLATNIWYL